MPQRQQRPVVTALYKIGGGNSFQNPLPLVFHLRVLGEDVLPAFIRQTYRHPVYRASHFHLSIVPASSVARHPGWGGPPEQVYLVFGESVGGAYEVGEGALKPGGLGAGVLEGRGLLRVHAPQFL